MKRIRPLGRSGRFQKTHRPARPGRAVVLLSGGLDSATALYWALKMKKWDCRAIAFDYGQRHRRELRSARAVARRARVPLQVVSFRLPWGGSRLLDKGALPDHPLHAIGRGPIPSTYVPARNTVFLSFAFSCADALDVPNVVIGANALDYSGYPDCRPAYLRAMETVGRRGTRLGAERKKPPRLWAPLLRLNKADIVRLAFRLRVPLKHTWSCYAGGARPCGRCDSCRLRADGFRRAGRADPADPRPKVVSSTGSRQRP
ncbi:MAG: 7-cyano-7-deazaguanine synthase QueC [Elusimicrobia bacterium]|nr:7-cyano-7-deazaguanine synthase QueC [Elusimicrobiota bacterium]